MKKRFVYITGALLSVGTLTSCEKYLDINVNPNTAEEVEPRLLFSSATVYYVNTRSSGDLYIPMALAGQSIATGGNNPTGWGIPSEEQYVISPFLTGNTWSSLYSSVGGNLKQLIALAEKATPVNNNAAAQAKTLLALAGYDATTLFGDVPFSEAWNTEIPYPKFDSQEDVLEGVISMLDEAYTQFDEAANAPKISDYDLFYKGDIAKWKKVNRSLKLRTLMTMVDRDPSKAEALGQLVAAGGMISSPEDNFLVNYQEDQTRANPKWRINDQYNAGNNFFFGSNYVVDFMQSQNDPRLPSFFDKPAAAEKYVGVKPGEDGNDDVHVRISTDLHRADAPEIFFTYQEQLFYEAEIQARGLGAAADVVQANTLYKKAVEESAKFFGVAAAEATVFTASLPDLTAATALENIHYQHWIDKMDRGLDAFTQWRRSGPSGQEVPALTLPTGAPAEGLFRRYPYPVSNEIAVNPNAPQETTYYFQNVWFDL